MSFVVVLTAALIGVASWWYWFHTVVPLPPSLSTPLTTVVIRTPHGERRHQAFVPAGYRPGAPIVFVLHGSRSNSEQMRANTGFEFERLAERDGFIVVYPEGFEGYWNDCRVKGNWASRRLKIDDVGFLRSLVERVRNEHGTGPSFFVGYSNGGHMCFRMAFEAPETIGGIAVVAANLPTSECLTSTLPQAPLSTMFINGTRDPINPYHGGRVTIFGVGDRGYVHSAPESAAILAGLLGAGVRQGHPEQVVPTLAERATWVERRTWTSPGGEVALLTVHGGGHVVPQSGYRFPRILGATEQRLNAPAECWAFFQRIVEQHQ